MDIHEALEKVQKDLGLRKSLYAAADSEMDRLRMYDDAIDECKRSGDMVSYKAMTDERKRIEETLSKLREELVSPVSNISVEKLSSLWQSDTRIKNSVFKKKLAAYEQTKKLFLSQLLELIDLQQDALRLREDTAVAILGLWEPDQQVTDRELFRTGINYVSYGLDGLELMPDRIDSVAVVVAGAGSVYPDVVPFLASGDLSLSQCGRVTRVAKRRIP